ncbi:MAG TPA: hypothetical protein VFX97_08395 [Pyrinomonadaceae bacterium]|nr:hypothetical protein [Pyrinomonadaceae bacterium]
MDGEDNMDLFLTRDRFQRRANVGERSPEVFAPVRCDQNQLRLRSTAISRTAIEQRFDVRRHR